MKDYCIAKGNSNKLLLTFEFTEKIHRYFLKEDSLVAVKPQILNASFNKERLRLFHISWKFTK